jgi:hypothetical protein
MHPPSGWRRGRFLPCSARPRGKPSRATGASSLRAPASRHPGKNLKRQVFLGTDTFVESMQSRVPSRLDLREVPQARGRPIPRPLHDYAQAHAERNEAIKAGYASGGYRMQEIGD